MLTALQVYGYGFLGIGGWMAAVLWAVVFIVIGLIVWKMLELVLPKLISDAAWQQVIRLLIILFVFLLFLHFIGLR